jgi:3-oxoacyl-[acyl-carrier-protein] synthase-3
MSSAIPRIIGVGYDVPANVRKNDDPIFNCLKRTAPPGADLFQGYDERRVLAADENLMTIMRTAALAAIRDAGLEPSDVDLLLGCGSVSPYISPNELCRLHHKIGLHERAWVVPLANDFSNFNAGLLFADAFVRGGRAKYVLIVIAGNWTRFVCYKTSPAVSAGDGAGAAIVGLSTDASQWEVVDQNTITQSEFFGTMYMQGDCVYTQGNSVCGLWSAPYFHITPEGIKAFTIFGENAPPRAVTVLLRRHGLVGDDVALISHQASKVLMDKWQAAIQPNQYVETIRTFANMTVATIPVNLAWAKQKQLIIPDQMILLGIGPDMHTNAVLLRRAKR